MKKLSILLLMLPAVLLFYGCPIGVDYPAGEPGTEKIDNDFIGTWKQDDTDKEILKFTITKKDKYSYKIVIDEQGTLYGEEATEFTGWVTTIKGKHILFAKALDGTKYYMYEYSVKKKTLTTHDIGLLDGGVEAVTSTEALRKEIETSLGMEGALSEETIWTKQ
jgi:hypothetical protein